MGINVWYGESFRDLKEAFFEQIAGFHAEESGHTRVVILVPEAAKLDIETDYLRSDMRWGMMQVEVLSFSRLCIRILEEIGKNNLEYTDETGQTMLVYRILRENEKEFVVFGNLCRKPGFVPEILSVMGELNRFLVDGDKLAEAAKKISDPIVSRKASELSFLMNRYRQELQSLGLSDPQENYSLAADAIEVYLDTRDRKSPCEKHERLFWLRGIKVYVLGFARQRNFTPQEMRLIELLARVGSVSVAVSASCVPSDREAEVGEQELFFAGQNTLLSLQRWSKEQEAPIKVLPKRKPLFEHLANCFQKQESTPYCIESNRDGSIHLLYAASKREEVALTAGKIQSLIRDQGYRYRDILLAVSNMEDYLPVIQAVFRQAKIPLYADEKKSLTKTALGQMVRSLLNAVLYTESNSYMMSYLRSGLSGANSKEIDEFETFLLRKGIRNRRNWFDLDRYREDLSQADFRDRILKNLIPFEQDVLKASTAGDFSDALMLFLQNEEIEARTEKAIKDLLSQGEEDAATALAKAWNQLLHLLDQIRKAGGNAPMDFRGFKEILTAGMNNSYAAAIPSCLDQVRLTQVRQLPVQSPKALFLMGMTAEEYPGKTPPEGLLKDWDRECLAEVFQIPIPSMAADKLYEDQFLTYSLMTLPEEILLISVPGQPGQEAGAVRFLKTCLSGYEEFSYHPDPKPLDEQIISPDSGVDLLALHMKKTLQAPKEQPSLDDPREDEFAQAYKVFRENKELSGRLHTMLATRKRSRMDIRISKEMIRERYGQPILMSVSQLENYSSCSFMHYVRYILRCQPRPEYRVAATDSGNMLHRIAQECVSDFIHMTQTVHSKEELEEVLSRFRSIDYEQYVNRQLDRIAISAGQEIFLEKGVRASEGRRTCRLASATLKAIFDRLAPDGFLPREIEWKFARDLGNALRIELPDFPEIYFRGLIDRVDCLGNQYKVIDYKSSVTQVNYDRCYQGLSLQLFAYIAAYGMAYPASEPEEAGYLTFARPILSLENEEVIPDKPDHHGKIAQEYRLKGTRMEPAQLRAAGEFTVGKIRQLTRDLLEGRLKALPRRTKSDNLPCEYCEYSAVCGFEQQTDRAQILGGLPSRLKEDGTKQIKAQVFAEIIDAEQENQANPDATRESGRKAR
jgi:ATP-dependent helicase/nuclease subunit B